MRFLSSLSFAIALLLPACMPEAPKARPPADCGVYFDYAATYQSTLEATLDDEAWTDEFDIVVQQNGPAIMLANVLGLADSEGMSFGHSVPTLDYWINGGEPVVITYSGASRSNEPFTIDLTIDVEYPNLDDGWDDKYVYVITLGEPVDFDAFASTAPAPSFNGPQGARYAIGFLPRGVYLGD